MSLVEIDEVKVRYGATEALKGASLTLDSSEFVAILGPSGCGKTTLLRAVAGFVRHDGTIRIDGQVCNDVPPHKRNIGIVFQDYALFPHKTVRENIAFGPRLRKLPNDLIGRKTDDLLRLLHLDGLGDRHPGMLSGGQRQRVAVARALAIEPRVLLLDEPLSALDRKLREEMQVELRQLQRRVGITSLIVTHDQEEALALADKVVVMNHGEICQIGTPSEIYERPNSRFVANFIGKSNVFEGRALGSDNGALACRIFDDVTVRVGDSPVAAGSTLYFSVRPERLTLSADAAVAGAENRIGGRIDHVLYLGARQQIRVVLPNEHVVVADTPSDEHWSIGQDVAVSWKPADAVVLEV